MNKTMVTKITTTNGEFYADNSVGNVLEHLKTRPQWLAFYRLTKVSVPYGNFPNIGFRTRFRISNRVAIKSSKIVSICDMGEYEVVDRNEA